jgi:hypothetical protein
LRRAPPAGAVIALLISLALGLAIVIAQPQPVPPELSALIAKAQIQGPVADWCRGDFHAGGRRGYAVGVSLDNGGRYLVIDADGKVSELATFSGGADLSCYTPAEARRLNRGIASSETISGSITPRGNTSVVCAFVEDTSAVCWQYSPSNRAFVKIGGWIT